MIRFVFGDKMGKSVVIIGKGPSVKKSTKEFVDSFDDVAIINFPPMEDYNHLISNRAKYLFINAGSFRPYSRDFLNKLGLKYIFNISRNVIGINSGFMPDKNNHIYYESDFGAKTKIIHAAAEDSLVEDKRMYDLDPGMLDIKSVEIDNIRIKRLLVKPLEGDLT